MTPEEFAQLQPGDDVIFIGISNSFVTNGKSYKVVQKHIKLVSITNNLNSVGYFSNIDKISKVKKEIRFKIGKQYKNINKQKIHTCIAFSPEGWPILRSDPSYTNVIILKPDSHVKDHWEEYIPPVIHKRYVHWYRIPKSGVFIHATVKKVDRINGYPVLHVQEVSFEEKKTE